MGSARRLYLLAAALGTAGAAATALALIAATTRISFQAPSLEAFLRACQRLGLTDLSVPALLVLSLGSLSLAVLALASRSALIQLRDGRRFLNGLRISGWAEVDGCRALVVDDERPLAFCAGLLRPRVYVSRGTLALLDESQLAAVVAHEAHHVGRRDPLRLFTATAVAEGLFFLPVLGRLADRYAALAELAADDAAISRRGRKPLAAALLAFDAAPSWSVVGIAPERVDHLVGEPAGWRLPTALLLGAGVTLAGLVALGLQTTQAAAHASVALPALLAQACMVAMTLVPAMLGAVLLIAWRRGLRRSGALAG